MKGSWKWNKSDQRKTDTVWSYLYVEKRNIITELIDRIGSCQGLGEMGEMDEGGQKMQTFSCKSWDQMYSMMTRVNTTVLHVWSLSESRS